MKIAILSEADHRIAVGFRLRQAIELLEMTPAQAARIMATTRHNLDHKLSGRQYPATYALYRFCRATGVPEAFILTGDWSGLPPDFVAQLATTFAGKSAGLLGAESAATDSASEEKSREKYPLPTSVE